MRSIWKFDLPVRDVAEVEMPAGARVLTVQTQHGNAQLWAIVDTEAPKETRRFFVIGTGHSLPDAIDDGDGALKHLGTFQLFDGGFIGHVFEEEPSTTGS